MSKMIRRFLQNEGGATAIEYGLIAALIGLAIVVGVGGLGEQVSWLWGNNNSRLVQTFE